MKTWLSIAQISSVTGWTDRHVRRLADAGKIESRSSDRIAANGRAERDYALESLPAEFQVKYARTNQLVLSGANGESVRALTPQEQAKAEDQAKPVEKLEAWINGERPIGLTLPCGTPVRNSNDFAALIAPQYGLTASGLWKRYIRYKRDGLKGLAGARKDKGTSRFFEKYPEAAKFILAKKGENLSDAHITDALRREWPNLYNHGSKSPSYTTVACYLKTTLPPVLRDRVKLNDQQHAAKFAPYLVTDFTKLRVNEIWVSDHRIHDVFFQNDCFDYRPRLCALRLWETAIIDMRSRVIVASVWNTTPSSRTIASALRVAISRFGIPEYFYVDNGKDYRKIGRGAATGHETPEQLDEQGRVPIDQTAAGVLARLGIKVKYCKPRHPQSKLIESYFSHQSKRFDQIFGAAYSGPRPDRRPDACGAAIKLHNEFLKGERRESPLPLASEGIHLALAWTELEYNRAHRHTGHGMDRRTPYEVFDELFPVAQRRPVDVSQIEELFWDRNKRIVTNGTVQINNAKYEGADDIVKGLLYGAGGTEITIACDPFNIGDAIAFDSKGRFMGSLVSQQLVERGPLSHEQIQQMERLRRKLARASKDFYRLVGSGVPSELDLMRARTGVVQMPQPPAPPRDLPYGAPRALAAAAAAPAYSEDLADEVMQMLDEKEAE
jgi:transposase InsO family protein